MEIHICCCHTKVIMLCVSAQPPIWQCVNPLKSGWYCTPAVCNSQRGHLSLLIGTLTRTCRRALMSSNTILMTMHRCHLTCPTKERKSTQDLTSVFHLRTPQSPLKTPLRDISASLFAWTPEGSQVHKTGLAFASLNSSPSVWQECGTHLQTRFVKTDLSLATVDEIFVESFSVHCQLKKKKSCQMICYLAESSLSLLSPCNFYRA